jgi:ribosomal protein S18 acetylase RimI-like enzyme
MQIRPAGVEEWERVRDLRLRALGEAPDAFGELLAGAEAADPDHWRRYIAGWPESSEHAVLVAEDDGGWWGMTVADRRTSSPHRAHLYGMWVDPARRGEGIGAALVEAVVGWARELGVGTVKLGVTETNPAAIALYRRAGFEPTGGAEPLREGSSVRCLRLERTL